MKLTLLVCKKGKGCQPICFIQINILTASGFVKVLTVNINGIPTKTKGNLNPQGKYSCEPGFKVLYHELVPFPNSLFDIEDVLRKFVQKSD